MLEPETHYPLKVVMCEDCGLAQLSHVVSPEILYRHDYPYEASITQTGRRHWAELAATVSELLKLSGEDLVIDIGSNVGVLLEAFRNCGTRILGIDPASNIVRLAEKRNIPTVNEFFSLEVADQIVRDHGHATVITATNVFAHVNDLDSFVKSVNILLNDRGMLILEVPYFLNLVKNLEYDTIYHEHLSYISIKPIVSFFRHFGMEIVNLEEKDIHGGSIRLYIARIGRTPVSPLINEFVRKEDEFGLYKEERLLEFSCRVERNRQDLVWLLYQLRHEGKKLAAVSAPAKGMTLLNYCRIGTDLVEFVTEKSKLKIGRFTPGTHIPVLPDDELLHRKPDYCLLLAWNFAEEIMQNLKEYRAAGGKFIIPIPVPKIV